MDDYLPGNSSMNFVIKNKLTNVIKIDKESFGVHGATIAFEQFITQLHSYNIRVICEGVDTIERKKHLDKIGVWGRQGYLNPARMI